MARLKVISYFSYKGGAGRSTLAFNTIPILAKEHLHPTKDHPIIIIDTDLDSCGMSYLLGVDADVKDDCCTQDLLKNGLKTLGRPEFIWQHPNFKDLFAVGECFGCEKESILFLAAKDVKNVDEQSNYTDANNPFVEKLKNFIDICKYYKVPAVILDAAVGNNATANATNQVSNIVVCCMRPTIQFVNGTVRFLRTLEQGGSFDGRKKIVVVPNVIPQEEVTVDNKKYPGYAITRINSQFNELAENTQDITYNLDMLDESEFGIPAVKSFMWREGQLYTQQELNDNEKLALERYRKLAAVISDC
ncbi:MAG: hypothetical protein E7544_00030 [Ruminococcaceae bacterium]|nr:hypothetical protein [Oscillospiraceae bacterium]